MLSQNGWTAGTGAVTLTTVVVPGTAVRLPVAAGDVATVLRWAATRWHHEVEPLVMPGCWGFADRTVRGDSAVSNHASGTAIDLNAPAHPLGTPPSQTMTAAQIAADRRIVADSGGVLRWGGDYTGRQDPMHLEINASATAVAALAARITTKVPTTPPEEDDVLTPQQQAQLDSITQWTDPNNGTVPLLVRQVAEILATPLRSAVEGSDFAAPPRDFWALIDAATYRTEQQIAGLTAAVHALADAHADPAAIKTAITEAMQSVVHVQVSVAQPAS
jgi:hypothetical protein